MIDNMSKHDIENLSKLDIGTEQNYTTWEFCESRKKGAELSMVITKNYV